MKVHKTFEGDEMYIAEMDDSHLKNTIDLHILNFKKAAKALNKKDTNTINGILYKNVGMTAEKAKWHINDISEKLPAYIMEAVIRGIDYSKQLQEIFGRSAQLYEEGVLLLDFSDDED